VRKCWEYLPGDDASHPTTGVSMFLQFCRERRASFSREPSAQRGPSSEDASFNHACSHIIPQEQDNGLPSMSRTAMLLRSCWNAGSAKDVILLFLRLRTRRRGIPLKGDPWIAQMLLLSICEATKILLKTQFKMQHRSCTSIQQKQRTSNIVTEF
jgi:hypothetical protein